MLLIQEMLEEGYTLDSAIEKVNKRMVVMDEAFKKLADTLDNE